MYHVITNRILDGNNAARAIRKVEMACVKRIWSLTN